MFEPVGHQKIDTRAEHAQAAHADRAGGGAVGVVVGDDEQSFVLGDGVGQQHCGALDVQQIRRRQQLRQAVRDLLGVGDAARCIQPCPGGCEAGLLEGGAEVGGAGTGGDGGHGAIVWADAPGRLNQGFRIW